MRRECKRTTYDFKSVKITLHMYDKILPIDECLTGCFVFVAHCQRLLKNQSVHEAEALHDNKEKYCKPVDQNSKVCPPNTVSTTIEYLSKDMSSNLSSQCIVPQVVQ